ncbi:hypothetical protein [Haloarchaeobius salinus]|uniref:hypothetical protein n=1 Tax=Haloarchaeobius salinus TaxID=1198298 RepID=UPI00210B4E48|nr:hypothetical protein [Haloarchaeobius salinus]
MTDRDRRERLAEYVAVLRGFGRSDAEILAAHGEETLPDGLSLPEFFDHRFDDADESTLYGRLHDTLATGAGGIDADREYWAHAPARQLDEACRAHGWRVALSGDDPIDIVVETPDGERRESTFSYPDSELGQHNYPALVAAVAEHLDGLTFALLTDRDGRWRFVCVETDLLAGLRDRYGERVRVFRRPLLRAEQPQDFAADDDSERDRGSELASVAGDAFAESVGTGPRVHRSSRSLDTGMDVDAGPETVVGEGIDEVFETIEAGADDGPTEPAAAGANAGVDEDVASLLSDLDEPTHATDEDPGGPTVTRSSADAADDDVPPTDSAGLVGGGPKTTVVEDGLDDVFADMAETNPRVREDDPERMTTDDVLDSVDAGPADAGVAQDRTEDAEVGDSPGTELAETSDGPEPVRDPDELTTPVESSSPSETPGTEAPTGPATEGPGEMEDSRDADEPAATPSIDELDLDVDEDDVPEFDADAETDTAGPLAGGVGPSAAAPPSDAGPETDEQSDGTAESPDISPADPIDADLLADPDESALADAEADDGYDDVIVGRLDDENGSRGPFGRLAAWLRNLF